MLFVTRNSHGFNTLLSGNFTLGDDLLFTLTPVESFILSVAVLGAFDGESVVADLLHHDISGEV